MQSDVVKIFVLGDFHEARNFLRRLVFGDIPSTRNALDESSSFPYNTHTSSYLLDNDRYYTLQFWEIRNDEDLQRLDSLTYPQPDLFVMLFDASKRSSFKKGMTSLRQEVKINTSKTPLLVIASKMDLPSQTEEFNENFDDPVSMSEAHDVAKSIGSLCVECCPMSGQGVQEAAYVMVHMAVYGQKKMKQKRCRLFKKKQNTRPKHLFPSGLVIDPSGNYGMENAPKCPGVNVLASTCVEDLARMKNDTTCLDVRFTFQDDPQSPIEAHQVILISAAPELFQDIFTGTAKAQISGRPHELFEKVSWPVNQAEKRSDMVEIRVCEKVPRREFLRLIEFLYMGASIADLQKDDSIQDLLTIAKTFNLSELFEACENVLEGNEMENVMKPSFVGGGKAKVLKDLFFDKPLLDDLVFQVQGSLIYAHQAVIIARSRTLADKISDYRRENPGCIRVKVEIDDVSMETFKSLLEYLYTDDVQRSLKQEVLLELLGLATAYQLPRLVTLCEYQLIVSLSEDSNHESVMNILLLSKEHNAQQLDKWYKNLIARNYVHFKTCAQYELLKTIDKEYIERHQWPPKCDLSEENRLALDQYLADRKSEDNADTTTCCVII